MTEPQTWVTPTYVRLADLLADAPADAWDAPSLCEKWLVRHVVAHVTMPVRLTPQQFGAEMAAAGGTLFGVGLTGSSFEASDSGWHWEDSRSNGRAIRADGGSLVSLLSGRRLPDGRKLPRR